LLLTVNNAEIWVSFKQKFQGFDSSPKDFIKVASSGSGVSKSKTDGLLGVNDEDGADLAQILVEFR